MGFRFRKRIKILPGVSVNIGKNGVSSVSIGPKGMTTNYNLKSGKSQTPVGLPGSGISYTHKHGSTAKPHLESPSINERDAEFQDLPTQQYRRVGYPLGFGVLIAPYVFSWFLLRSGYSTTARVVSFAWLAIAVFVGVSGK